MKNRFVLAPMTNTQSEEDGRVSLDEIDWLNRRAEGGFGQIVTCASSVSPQGRGFHGEIGFFDDSHVPGLKRLTQRITAADSLVTAQLNHAGMRSVHSDRVSASDDADTGARALTLGEIDGVVDDFVSAAQRAERAGFDGVQIHGAHGYLLAQFLSRTLNRREDEYGGPLENRSRLVFRVVRAIREATGDDFQVGIRLSPERYGQDFCDIKEVASRLLIEGEIDYLDMSLWNVFKVPDDGRAQGKTLLKHFTSLERGNVRLGVAGRIVEPAQAAACLEAGADYVSLGKVAIVNGDYPNRLRHDRDYRPRWIPVSSDYLREQRLGEKFIEYLAPWPNFIEDLEPSAGSRPFTSAWTPEQLGLVPETSPQ